MDGRYLLGKASRMPSLNLTDEELQDAAQAARIAAVQAEADANRQTNPAIKATFARCARRWRELANKFDRARVAAFTTKPRGDRHSRGP